MSQTIRPWGLFEVLHTSSKTGPTFQIKKLVVNPNSKLSLQSHEYRSEHWVVIEGEGKAVIGEDTIVLGPNTHVFVPRKVKHRLMNPTNKRLVLIEVQTGITVDENDIVRYEDDYNRAERG